MTESAGSVTEVESTAARCLQLLRSTGATLATAESLTAGLVAATLASVPGASDVLRGGLIAYATEIKTSVLRVDPALLATHGVISAECAGAMAECGRDLFGATWCLSATGVAGPSRQEGKPAGTVFVAVAGPDVVRTEALDLAGSRAEIREATVVRALILLASCAGYDGVT